MVRNRAGAAQLDNSVPAQSAARRQASLQLGGGLLLYQNIDYSVMLHGAQSRRRCAAPQLRCVSALDVANCNSAIASSCTRTSIAVC